MVAYMIEEKILRREIWKITQKSDPGEFTTCTMDLIYNSWLPGKKIYTLLCPHSVTTNKVTLIMACHRLTFVGYSILKLFETLTQNIISHSSFSSTSQWQSIQKIMRNQ